MILFLKSQEGEEKRTGKEHKNNKIWLSFSFPASKNCTQNSANTILYKRGIKTRNIDPPFSKKLWESRYPFFSKRLHRKLSESDKRFTNETTSFLSFDF